MELTGTYPIAAPPAAVWEILQNPLRLQAAMPDCERLTYLGGGQYWGVLNMHAGLGQSRFEGKIVLSEVQPGVGYRLQAEGHGVDGRLAGNGRIWLAADGPNSLLHYAGEVQVEGAVAEMGTRYLETAARAIIRQNLSGLAGLAAGEETAVLPPEPSAERRHHGRLYVFLSGFLLALVTLLAGGVILILRFYRLWLRHFAREVAGEVVAFLDERDKPSSGNQNT